MDMRIAVAAAVMMAAVPAAADQHHFEFMRKERIGELRIEMPEREVRRVLPGPAQRGSEIYEAADGLYKQKWTFSKLGIALTMSSETKGGAKRLHSVACRAGCTLTTSRGIGIGSPLEEVQRAYAAEFNSEESKLPEIFVAGSIYGGLVLNFSGGKVSAMHLGAAAE